ncbi:hypothetical protein SAMN04488515_2104 [Cognatiyoonia koreensis]|uniref:Uncharacterized protein n=1 Tax=Cognatiyoonia koreensis TaxID=364200 RepID=A0A1I0QQK1_9RHOB|nr:hypothetical protein [Cognatiyoonia koreensis]SEW29750.1 hypothetical protein SAMN04488515_2104 [Cognatiyoonia koreensis]
MKPRTWDWTTKVIIASAFVMAGMIAFWVWTGNFAGFPVFMIAAVVFVGLGAIERMRYQQRAPVSKEDQMRVNILRGLRDKN